MASFTARVGRLFAIHAVPGRGLGWVALADIAVGTRLLAEAALTVEGPGLPTIEETVGALSDADSALFFELAFVSRGEIN